MRYRQVSYRHARVVRYDPTRLLQAAWSAQRLDVTLTEPWWRPEADVLEGPDTLTVLVALAGVPEDQIEITLFEDALVIQGERWLGCCDEAGVYQVASIPQGSFCVEVPLGFSVDAARIAVRYQDGLLRITLPRRHGEA